jgi:predicted nicotinamide N-methyase
VLLADPGRAYLPREGMAEHSRHTIPTTLELEDRAERKVVIARLLPF